MIINKELLELYLMSTVVWIMFGLIYGLLFLCWVFAMKRVIQIGPIECGEADISKSFFYIGEKDD